MQKFLFKEGLFIFFVFFIGFSCMMHFTYKFRKFRGISGYLDTAYIKRYFNESTKSGIKLTKSNRHTRYSAPENVHQVYMTGNMSYKKIKDSTAISNILTERIDNRKLDRKHYAKRFRRVTDVDCLKLFNHKKKEIRRANKIPLPTIQIERYRKMTAHCKNFRIGRGYITDYLSKEEQEFPIAYSILMYKDVEQVERLLRAIYRPQNVYCLHVDKKTSYKIFAAMKRILRCFSNVFMAPKRISVVWGEMTVLEPEIICMNELWKRNKKWKYFINLTGQEFPLKTNYELVKILKVYNGSNDVEATLKRYDDNIQSI